MNTRSQLLCTWSGAVYFGMFLVGFVLLARFIPPLSPLTGADEIAAIFRERTVAIRAGNMLMMLGSGLAVPFAAAIAVQLRRIEGNTPVLAYAQLGAGAFTGVITLIPAMIWTLMAFRPERDPETLLLLSDAAWIWLVMPVISVVIQCLVVGMAVLSDRSAIPVYARWVGYFNLWLAFLLLPGALITFFKSGPFAWNGVFTFWMPLSLFGLWYIVMIVVTTGVIRRQAASDR
jgi:hypothetical protein